jgi:hypothetical protein
MSKRNGEIPLPQGWELGRDYDGKVYFIDHNSKKTTWVDPRDRFVNILDTINLNYSLWAHPSNDAETCCRLWNANMAVKSTYNNSNELLDYFSSSLKLSHRFWEMHEKMRNVPKTNVELNCYILVLAFRMFPIRPYCKLDIPSIC